MNVSTRKHSFGFLVIIITFELLTCRTVDGIKLKKKINYIKIRWNKKKSNTYRKQKIKKKNIFLLIL